MDITNALLATQQPDANLRNQAEQYLANLEKQNLTLFLLTLVNELANEQKPNLARQAAGLKLKNIFESRSKETKLQLANQWRGIPPDVKTQIRTQVLNILHSPVREARRTSAQILSTLSIIELNSGQWIEVIDFLCQNITQPKSEFGVEASLVAIGYICEECVAPILQTRSDHILTAVIQGFRQEQKNQEIRLAAGKALCNILSFIKGNFQKDNERSFILKTICDATVAQNEEIRYTAMECLAHIAYLYYDKLKDYMEILYNITMKAAKTDVEKVALQALEFWTTIAEIECDIQEDMKFAQLHNQPATRVTFNFVRAALKPLVLLLTELLAAQPDEAVDDEDEITRYTSAGTTLAAVAKVVGDEIVVCTMPFISQHINNTNWKYREAATLAFSAILDGPTSKDKMKALVNQAVPVMLSHVSDKEVIVRDTTVFTIGRIAEFHFDALADGGHLDNIMKALVISLKDEPRVASKAAWSLCNIAEALDVSYNPDITTSPLSPYFVGLVKELLAASQRQDSDESNLRLNIYGALSAVIGAAAPDQNQHLEGIMGLIMQKLADTFKQSGLNVTEKEEIYALQGLLCTILVTLTNKLKDNVKRAADQLFSLYVTVFQYKNAIVDDAMMAISALAAAVGKDFEKYLPVFKPYLITALKNKADVQTCITAVNAVGELSISLGLGILPLCDEIITIYLTHLQDQTVSRSIKPLVIASFGDIALAIGGHFEKYIKFVATILKKASEVQVENSSEEMLEYFNLLRENIFEAYTGILQGLKTEKLNAFHPFVDDLINFIKAISQDETVDEIVFYRAVQMIGDLAIVYQQRIRPMLEQPFIRSMVDEAMKSEDEKTKECGKWTNKQLKKIMQ